MGLGEWELAVPESGRAGLCSGPSSLPAAHCASGHVKAAGLMLSTVLTLPWERAISARSTALCSARLLSAGRAL